MIVDINWRAELGKNSLVLVRRKTIELFGDESVTGHASSILGDDAAVFLVVDGMNIGDKLPRVSLC